MTLVEAIALIESAGGKVQLRGKKVFFRLPKGEDDLATPIAFLRERKKEVASLLQSRCTAGTATPETDEMASTFAEVWLVDFEFREIPGNLPDPLCLVAYELISGKTVR